MVLSPMSPMSSTLAALSVARGTYMDSITIRKWHITFGIFLAAWFFLFSIFVSFYPEAFLGDTDYLSAVGVQATEDSGQAGKGNGVLSDSGRSLVWGSSLGFALLIAFVYHFFYVQFF